MTVYTNDIDTLRQMISRASPAGEHGGITVVTVFCSCCASLALTVVAWLWCAMLLCFTTKVHRPVRQIFRAQQRESGQGRTAISRDDERPEGRQGVLPRGGGHRRFDALNDELCDSADKANRYANILMPVIANIGNLLLCAVAIIGGCWPSRPLRDACYGGWRWAPSWHAFPAVTKQFHQPINQVSQQFNSWSWRWQAPSVSLA